jgi:hypothetical protein
VGIGEKPYLDPNSRSRTEVLEERKEKLESDIKEEIDASNTVTA